MVRLNRLRMKAKRRGRPEGIPRGRSRAAVLASSGGLPGRDVGGRQPAPSPGPAGARGEDIRIEGIMEPAEAER
jgi:hypothetical protein